nr:UPF0481 protein At3g47200-like [Ipomoea batatas]
MRSSLLGLTIVIEAQSWKNLTTTNGDFLTMSYPSPGADFIEMMILDSCFILGHMYVYTSQEDKPTHPPNPIVTRDMLKLENQIPYFILFKMYNLMKTINDDSLELLALKFFNLALPRRDEKILKRLFVEPPKHLLHLVYSSYLSSIYQQPVMYTPPPYSDQSIQCVRLLQRSGIKIRPVKANSFLDINFKKATLQIPPITINDYTTTLFINCIALEQCNLHCNPHIRAHFSAYIAFMSCLINSTRDVTLLGQDGIITGKTMDGKKQKASDLRGKGETLVSHFVQAKSRRLNSSDFRNSLVLFWSPALQECTHNLAILDPVLSKLHSTEFKSNVPSSNNNSFSIFLCLYCFNKLICFINFSQVEDVFGVSTLYTKIRQPQNLRIERKTNDSNGYGKKKEDDDKSP